jgi:glutamate/tyrosine decarboxylase-like PLP-dependent enzyme
MAQRAAGLRRRRRQDRDAHRRGLTIFDSYLVREDAARDQLDWNPEWSRRSRGFPVYAALRELGRDGLTALGDRCVDHCVSLVEGIGSLPVPRSSGGRR